MRIFVFGKIRICSGLICIAFLFQVVRMNTSVERGIRVEITEAALSTASKPFVTRQLPTTSPKNSIDDISIGPSWGLIIPILMIVVFLACVAVCLYWHKWRGKRSAAMQRDITSGSSFHRSYRGSSCRGVDTIRDSTRSTTPLRNSLNEKINTKQNNIKIKNVNVIPIQRSSSGKYAFYWSQNHWKAYPHPSSNASLRNSGSRPLSPINEVDTPSSNVGKLSDLSKSYDVSAQPSGFSPYKLTWLSHNPPSYEQSESYRNRHPSDTGTSKKECDHDYLRGYEPCSNSPFFPNNNTPTTECDVDSAAGGSQIRFMDDVTSSQYASYPSSPNMSRSNPGFSVSPEIDQSTSISSSYPETSYQPSSRQSENFSGYQNSGMTSLSDPHSGNISLPSSISQFQNQATMVEDHNNNSIVVPNAYMSFPTAKSLNYTLASSVASSDTQYSDNTSMLPNVGSHNTSGVQSGLVPLSMPLSVEESNNISTEDLSKLVDEMSSIRPNSSTEPSARVISMSAQSFSADFHRSCSNIVEEEQNSISTATTSQATSQNEGSFSWDSYPLNGISNMVVRSNPDLPLHVKEELLSRKQMLNRSPRMSFHVPVLEEKQYWV